MGINNLRISKTKTDLIEFEIKSINPHKGLLFVLLTIALACFIFPVSLFFIDELEIGFGIIITFAIFWGTAIYFTRKVLWNLIGKEVYQIKENEVIHYYDYKFFQDNKNTHKYGNLEITFHKTPQEASTIKNTDCYLALILNNTEEINSQIITDVESVTTLKMEYHKQFRNGV